MTYQVQERRTGKVLGEAGDYRVAALIASFQHDRCRDEVDIVEIDAPGAEPLAQSPVVPRKERATARLRARPAVAL